MGLGWLAGVAVQEPHVYYQGLRKGSKRARSSKRFLRALYKGFQGLCTKVFKGSVRLQAKDFRRLHSFQNVDVVLTLRRFGRIRCCMNGSII